MISLVVLSVDIAIHVTVKYNHSLLFMHCQLSCHNIDRTTSTQSKLFAYAHIEFYSFSTNNLKKNQLIKNDFFVAKNGITELKEASKLTL